MKTSAHVESVAHSAAAAKLKQMAVALDKLASVMNESSMTRNRKKRRISDALDETPMTHFEQVFNKNNDLAEAQNENSVTFRISLVEVDRANWSLGHGEAQYA